MTGARRLARPPTESPRAGERSDRIAPAGTAVRCPMELVGLRVQDAMVRRPKVFDPTTTVAQVRAFFEDDHVHAAVVVGGGLLMTVVERSDIKAAADDEARATSIGTLHDRVTDPGADLPTVWSDMRTTGRRRLAVVGDRGAFLGLLCLKRSGRGFCSDEGIAERARANEAARDRAPATDSIPCAGEAP